MKKLLLILSALLFITGCQVESASNANPNLPAEEDEYSDGIYLFAADWNYDAIYQVKIEYIYKEGSDKKTNSYYLTQNEPKITRIFKIDKENLHLIRISYQRLKDRKNNINKYIESRIANLDKSSFNNLRNGLYVIELYGFKYTEKMAGCVQSYLKRTKSIEDYFNNKDYLITEDFYNNKNVIFVKNKYSNKEFVEVYNKKIYDEDGDIDSFTYIKQQDVIGFLLHNPSKLEKIGFEGKHFIVDYSILKFNENTIDLTQLGTGYFYTEIDNDGNFTTPVKLNSYKEIINN